MNSLQISEQLEILLDEPMKRTQRIELAEQLRPLLADVFAEGWKAGQNDLRQGQVTANPYRWEASS
jgi:hypothetical protein